MNFFQALYLTHFSTPVDERAIYRRIRKNVPQQIVECGIQRGERMGRMLRLLKYVSPKTDSFTYVCTDPFEGRTEIDGPGLSLRKAHKLLSQLELRHRCIPAPSEMGIIQLSRSVKDVDFLVIAMPELDWLGRRGALLAATLADQAVIFLKAPGGVFQEWTPYQFQQAINQAAEQDRVSKKAAS